MSTKYFYLFCSFDLVNSTAYKYSSLEWYDLLQYFYSEIIKHFSDEGFEVWKFSGDEILLKKPVDNFDKLSSLVQSVYYGVMALSENIGNRSSDYYFYRLSFKTTLWCALINSEKLAGEFVDDIGNANHFNLVEDAENIQSVFKRNYLFRREATVDFVGSEIDIGFRISKFAVSPFVIISALLAYFLLKYANDSDKAWCKQCMHFISYEKLKGSWGNRGYPIIMLMEDPSKARKYLPYDAEIESKIAKKLLNIIKGKSEIECKVFKLLERMYNDQPLFRNIIDEIVDLHSSHKIVIPKPMNYTIMDAAVICFNPFLDKVLLAKRPVKDYNNRILWGVGTFELIKNNTYKDLIINEYKKDFDIILKPLIQQTNDMPAVVAVYEVGRKKSHGIIFTATADEKSDEAINNKAKTCGYVEAKWHKIHKGILQEKYSDDLCVSNLKVNIRSAYEMHKNLKDR